MNRGFGFCFLLLLATGSGWAQEEIAIEAGTTTRYLANSTDPGFGTTWFETGFVEGPEWLDGPFGVGYESAPPGSGAHALIATPVPAGTLSIYTRTGFTVDVADDAFSVFLGLDYDDGIVAWINGVEVYRSPEMRDKTLDWDTIPSTHESSNGMTPDYTPLRNVTDLAKPALVDGENLLAVAVWSNGTDDVVLVPQLVLNRMLTRAPYLQMGSSTDVVVRWRSGLPDISRVMLGPDPGDLSTIFDGIVPTTEHEVALSSLSPNTLYYYAVGSPTETLAGGNEEHFFLTPPPSGTPKPTRIWVLGDSGAGSDGAVFVRDAYYEFTGDAPGATSTRHTDLWLMLGDNAYPTGTDQQYQENPHKKYESRDANSYSLTGCAKAGSLGSGSCSIRNKKCGETSTALRASRIPCSKESPDSWANVTSRLSLSISSCPTGRR